MDMKCLGEIHDHSSFLSNAVPLEQKYGIRAIMQVYVCCP